MEETTSFLQTLWARSPEGVRRTFRALRYRNFRLFFIGQSISLTGSFMQQVALAWLVYRLTGSAFLLGVVGFAAQIPAFLLSPLAGMLADHYDRRRILILTQILGMVQAFLLAGLYFSGLIAVWQIVGLSIFVGVIIALDIPVRQAFVVEMVEKRRDLGNAIALGSFMFNGARLIGPSLAGILIAAAGEGLCFVINAVTFVAVILSLMAMRLRPRPPRTKTIRVWRELHAGLRYVFGFAPIRVIICLVGAFSLLGMPYVVLMPVFARDVLRGGPATLGFLMAASGLGALGGAVFLASRHHAAGLGRTMARAGAGLGCALIAFSFSRALWLSLGLMLLVGFGMMVTMVAANTLLQTITDDDKRGRVMSFYAAAFMGMMPVGSLLAGLLASEIGAGATLLIFGGGCLINILVFARLLPRFPELIHPQHEPEEIIPEVSPVIPLSGEKVP